MEPSHTSQIQEAIAEGEYYGMQTLSGAREADRGGPGNLRGGARVASRPQYFRLMVQSLDLGMTR